MAVDLSGNMYNWHRESKSFIGHLGTGVDEELRAKWKDNCLYAHPDCVACPIKCVCGGGCRLDSLERHGDIHKPDPVGCFFRRTMFEVALWVLCELGPEKLQAIIRDPHENRRGIYWCRLVRKAERYSITTRISTLKRHTRRLFRGDFAMCIRMCLRFD